MPLMSDSEQARIEQDLDRVDTALAALDAGELDEAEALAAELDEAEALAAEPAAGGAEAKGPPQLA